MPRHLEGAMESCSNHFQGAISNIENSLFLKSEKWLVCGHCKIGFYFRQLWWFPKCSNWDLFCWLGVAFNLLTVDGSEPRWSIGARDCSHVQDRQEQVWDNSKELDPEICHGLKWAAACGIQGCPLSFHCFNCVWMNDVSCILKNGLQKSSITCNRFGKEMPTDVAFLIVCMN